MWFRITNLVSCAIMRRFEALDTVLVILAEAQTATFPNHVQLPTLNGLDRLLMAEAGPSSSSTRSASPTALASSHFPHRPGRIHFPVDHGTSQAVDHGTIQSLGLGIPPSLRKSGNQGASLVFQQDDKRRRVKSVDASNGFEQSRPRHGHAHSSSRRTMSFSRNGEQRDLLSQTVSYGLLEPFSDEYDLCECSVLIYPCCIAHA